MDISLYLRHRGSYFLGEQVEDLNKASGLELKKP